MKTIVMLMQGKKTATVGRDYITLFSSKYRVFLSLILFRIKVWKFKIMRDESPPENGHFALMIFQTIYEFSSFNLHFHFHFHFHFHLLSLPLLFFNFKSSCHQMVRMSVLADCLKKISNAERGGKRQVVIRPSSKVIIKFLQCVQQHGKSIISHYSCI